MYLPVKGTKDKNTAPRPIFLDKESLYFEPFDACLVTHNPDVTFHESATSGPHVTRKGLENDSRGKPGT